MSRRVLVTPVPGHLPPIRRRSSPATPERWPVLPCSLRVALVAVMSFGMASSPLLAQAGGPPWRSIDHRVWPSPHASISQEIGVSSVEVSYGRPGVKGRQIWGDLVPYGRVWRVGADANTVFTLSDDAAVAGRALEAGRYALLAIPEQETWTLVFSRFTGAWGSFTYDESEDALRVEVEPRRASSKAEWMTFRFDDPGASQATLVLHWDELEIPVPIAFETHDIAIARFEAGLRDLSGFSEAGYVSGARYCLDFETHLEKGLEWASIALERQYSYDTLMLKALLLERSGRAAEAEPLFDEAALLAQPRQLRFLALRLSRSGANRRLAKVLERAIDSRGDTWRTRYDLAQAYVALGERELAEKHFRVALEGAPEDRRSRIRAHLTGASGDS